MAKRSKKKKMPSEVDDGTVPETPEIIPGKSWAVSWTIIVQVLVIVAAVLWIYWPALRGDWLWDDFDAITENMVIQSPAGLWSIWFEPGSQIDYYPIKASVQWLQWHFWGMDTLGYHLTNVVLHSVSALLVWRLLSKFGLRLAWLGGLIFAIHPVQVESVAWIAELKNTLSLPPILLAMCAYIDYEEHGKSRDYLLALGLFLVALLCKLSVALFPLVILLYLWWRRGRIGWRDLQRVASFFGIALLVGLITIGSGIWNQRFSHPVPGTMPVDGFSARMVAAGLSLSFCFSKCFLPVGLLPVYPKWPIDPASPVQYLPWLVLGGIIYWFWTKRRGWGRHILLGLGFFLINLAPCPGFIPAPDMAFTWVMDHFLYLPIIGLIGVVVAALGQLESQLPASFRPYGIGLVTVVLAFLAFGSHSYAKMYINQETLWTYELRHNPESYEAHNNLGLALSQQGRQPEAIEQFAQTLRLKPDYAEAYCNLGNALLESGRLPAAMEQFEQALSLNPDNAKAHDNLGVALQQTGRLTEAMEQYAKALRIKPDYAKAHFNLGTALLQTGRSTEAMEQFEHVLQNDPNDAEAHYFLGIALQQTGRLPEAMEQLNRALRIKPDFAEAHNYLGLILFQTGQAANAMEQFAQALKIKPDDAEVHNNLGQSLLQQGRGAEAIGEFKTALQLKPDYAEACYDLANALLQTNQVPESIERYEQALRLKPDYAEAHNNLGAALLRAARLSEAGEQFKQALRIKPDFATARDNLARLQILQKTAPAKN